MCSHVHRCPGRLPRSGPSSGRQEGRWRTGGRAGRIPHVCIFSNSGILSIKTLLPTGKKLKKRLPKEENRGKKNNRGKQAKPQDQAAPPHHSVGRLLGKEEPASPGIKPRQLLQTQQPCPAHSSPDENLKLPFRKALSNGDECLHTKPGQRGRRRFCVSYPHG